MQDSTFAPFRPAYPLRGHRFEALANAALHKAMQDFIYLFVTGVWVLMLNAAAIAGMVVK